MHVYKICFHSPYFSWSLCHSFWRELHWFRAKPHSSDASAPQEAGFLSVLPVLLMFFLFLLPVSSFLLFFPHLSSLLPCLLNEKSCNLSVQYSLVAQSCPTLCNPMDCSTPGLPVHHQLPEFTQTHVHWVSDATQPSHPLSTPSPPALNLSQHQGLFHWVSSSHQVAKVLEFQLQLLRTDFL